MGDGKAHKFGQPFVDLIARYVEENEIMRPDDFVMKTTVSKDGFPEYIARTTDRRLPLEDIAADRDMDMDELLTRIEAIVSTGFHLNISYYIKEELDPDVVEEIYDWFKTKATSDSLQEAIAALKDEYEELEIRLVRIKFLCEVAN